MEIAISVMLVAKILFFVLVSFFVAVFTLWPINDRPTGAGQVVFWLLLEVVLFAVMFNFVSFKIVT